MLLEPHTQWGTITASAPQVYTVDPQHSSFCKTLTWDVKGLYSSHLSMCSCPICRCCCYVTLRPGTVRFSLASRCKQFTASHWSFFPGFKLTTSNWKILHPVVSALPVSASTFQCYCHHSFYSFSFLQCSVLLIKYTSNSQTVKKTSDHAQSQQQRRVNLGCMRSALLLDWA